MLKKINKLSKNTTVLFGFLGFLAFATVAFSGWGIWRMGDISGEYKSKEDQTLLLAVNIKEKPRLFPS